MPKTVSIVILSNGDKITLEGSEEMRCGYIHLWGSSEIHPGMIAELADGSYARITEIHSKEVGDDAADEQK